MIFGLLALGLTAVYIAFEKKVLCFEEEGTMDKLRDLF